MKYIFSFVIMLVNIHYCIAQQYSIRGFVKTSGGNALEGSTVEIKNGWPGLGSITITDSSGLYYFNALQPGRYLLTANHTGYNKSSSDTIVINEQNRIASWVFILSPVAKQLESVTIQSNTSPVQAEAGKFFLTCRTRRLRRGKLLLMF